VQAKAQSLRRTWEHCSLTRRTPPAPCSKQPR
jgi:hypothetical protein